MSPTEPAQQQAGAASNSKKNKNKKKKNAAKAKAAAEDAKASEATPEGDDQAEDDNDNQSDGPGDEDSALTPANEQAHESGAAPATNGHATISTASEPKSPKLQDAPDTSARLEAMTQEREALRAEVEQMRKQLEGIQETHSQEKEQLKTELEQSEAAKEQAQEDYEALLERVEKIKENVGVRLQRGREDLEAAQGRIEELETENEELQKNSDGSNDELDRLKDELRDKDSQLTLLQSQLRLAQQQLLKDKEAASKEIQHLREEVEVAKDAMGDWEVLAMEERSVRESLAEKSSALEEQVTSLRESYERAASERDSQGMTIDGLQSALKEIQDARRKELREMVESSEQQLQDMKKLVQEADSRASEAEMVKTSLQKELERTVPFEKEVKEKNLLIGKLRHEAIVLNEHLTKALRYLKKTKPEDSIDRQIVTNHFLQFLALDRSDPKKFQILQIISGLLNWTDEQREQAGLARPGASGNTLRLPVSPFHRTPSTPSLNTEFFSDTTPTSAREKESLADLWAGFLERSAEEGSSDSKSRKTSMSSMPGAMPGSPRPDARGI